ACLDRSDRPVFNQLLFRRDTPYFCAFDLLWLNGRDVRGLGLIERKRLLRGIVPRSASCVLYVNHIEKEGVSLFREACRHDLEGIVAKWKVGPYTVLACGWSLNVKKSPGRTETTLSSRNCTIVAARPSPCT